ncbi:MAG: 50S ribosomal protein L9 [Candidatus Gracilibacteria bacterium]
MKVVFTKAVSKVARRGEVKNVADGYFRNFLYPRGLAVFATKGRINEAEVRRGRATAAVEQIRKNAAEVAKKLEGATVTVAGKATPKGKLYAAITADIVLKAVQEQLGLKLTDSMLVSHDPIKTVGKMMLAVQLSDEVKSHISVEITASKK